VLAKVFPSAAWREWVKTARVLYPGGEIRRAKVGKDLVTLMVPEGGTGVRLRAIDRRMNLEALYFRDAERGDLFGFHQGLGDFLQEWGIITDDVLIRTADGSKLLKDVQRPRVELELTVEEEQAPELPLGLPHDHQAQPVGADPVQGGPV
jgi:hypothetical protein